MRGRFAEILFLSLALAPVSLAAQPADLPEQRELRAFDERQHAIVVAGDVEAMRAAAHPALRVNAPIGQVIDRDGLLALLAAGDIATERFERVIEAITLTGDVGVVMGREIVEPRASSLSGRTFGTGALNRRFTNIYLRENGEWRFLARHANVVSQTGGE